MSVRRKISASQGSAATIFLSNARVAPYSSSKQAISEGHIDRRVSSRWPRQGLPNLGLIAAIERRCVSETFLCANLPPFPFSSFPGTPVKLDSIKVGLANAVRTIARLPASSMHGRVLFGGLCYKLDDIKWRIVDIHHFQEKIPTFATTERPFT
jgi:hypothetical protein